MKLKTVKGYTALSKALGTLGVSDHAMDIDVLREVDKPKDYPYTPYCYNGGKVAFWKGEDGYYAWPEIKHLTYEIHVLDTETKIF